MVADSCGNSASALGTLLDVAAHEQVQEIQRQATVREDERSPEIPICTADELVPARVGALVGRYDEAHCAVGPVYQRCHQATCSVPSC